MAMFEPGHLHIERHALNKDDYSYNLCIDYELAQDPKEGRGMQFTLHGTIEDKPSRSSSSWPRTRPSTSPAMPRVSPSNTGCPRARIFRPCTSTTTRCSKTCAGNWTSSPATR